MDDLIIKDRVFVGRLFITRNILSQLVFFSNCLLANSFPYATLVSCYWCSIRVSWVISRLDSFRFCFRQFYLQVRATVSGGFRLYNQFCVFIYAQLQVIFPACFLGNVDDWDSYLTLDLTVDNLPYKSVEEFLQDRDFSDLVDRSKISTPRRFVGQAISFYRCFIKSLFTSELGSSSLARGLSLFDEAVIRDDIGAHYSDSIQLLCGYFIQQNLGCSQSKNSPFGTFCHLPTSIR